MATPVSNSSVSAQPQQTSPFTTAFAPASSGVSNVGSSISSAAETQNEGFFACIAKPFVTAFDAVISFLASLFISEDERQLWRAEAPVSALCEKPEDDEILQLGLDRFMHLQNESSQWKIFYKACKELPAEKAKMFYDLLPLDMQKHLKRHIWESNGSDNNMGIFFGDAVIRDDIKGDLVLMAILRCRGEAGF